MDVIFFVGFAIIVQSNEPLSGMLGDCVERSNDVSDKTRWTEDAAAASAETVEMGLGVELDVSMADAAAGATNPASMTAHIEKM